MTWYELIHKTRTCRGFQWDGTMASVRGHLSDDELDVCQPRMGRDERGPYLMLLTAHGYSRTHQGDWIVSVTWKTRGIEIYGVKPDVLRESYAIGEEQEFDPVA